MAPHFHADEEHPEGGFVHTHDEKSGDEHHPSAPHRVHCDTGQ